MIFVSLELSSWQSPCLSFPQSSHTSYHTTITVNGLAAPPGGATSAPDPSPAAAYHSNRLAREVRGRDRRAVHLAPGTCQPGTRFCTRSYLLGKYLV